MEGDSLNIQNKIKDNFSLINIILLIVEIVFLFFAFIVFTNITKDDDNLIVGIDVKNSDEQISEMTDGLSQNINTSIYDILSINSGKIEDNISLSDAVVREGSVREKRFDVAGVQYVSFIVDVTEKKQSYWVNYVRDDEIDDTEGAPEVLTACLDSSEYIYGAFDCVDRSNGLARNNIVKEYLGYADFEDFYAYIDEGDLSRIKIVSRFYEHSPEQDAKYVEEVKGFVESLGIPVELFEYYIVPVDEIEIL